MNKWTTLTEHILKEESNYPHAQGNLTILLNQIAEGSKIIASHIKNSGLIDIEGSSGTTNVYHEEVQKLDELSNKILITMLKESGQVHTILSEEEEKPYTVTTRSGDYIVYLDPLDGSSNIDTNISVGTIFSIYHTDNGDILQKGSQQVAAGYILYGTSVIFVYTCNSSVHGFTLDPSIGSFLLSHPSITIPESSRIYSINEGYFDLYDPRIQTYLRSLKTGKKPYSHRYVGSMVADIHRTLLKGGIFLYPASKNSPEGKLRLLFEVNPLSFIVEKAGGKALSGDTSPLEITPTDFHQRVPIVLGSKDEVMKFSQF